MRDTVKWRKQSRLIMLLAKWKGLSPQEALDVFYSTNTYKLFSKSSTGIELMSDAYIFADLRKELS